MGEEADFRNILIAEMAVELPCENPDLIALMEWREPRTRPLLLRLSTPFKCLTDMCCCAMEYIVLAVVGKVVDLVMVPRST